MLTYLLIDDDIGAAAEATIYAEALEKASAGELKLNVLKPDALPKTLQAISEMKPDGLFLDVAFTNALTDQKEHVGFDGIALAQQIRTLQTRGRSMGSAALQEFPIIRFSKKDVIREYVNEDTTSDDLFDELIDKGDVVDNGALIALRARVLASDYPRIVEFSQADSDESALAAVLGCEAEFLPRLDPRVLLGLRRPGAPAHAFARYFTAKLLARPGPLISEDLLAVRLGVDLAKSQSWPDLRKHLDSAHYRGAFGEGYPRWWQAMVVDWWQTQINSEKVPARITAAERVAYLKKALGLEGLVALSEDADSPGTRYWHRCLRSRKPVDPSEAFALMPLYGHESWQDADYLCLEEALRDRRNPRFAPPERSRIAARLSARGKK